MVDYPPKIAGNLPTFSLSTFFSCHLRSGVKHHWLILSIQGVHCIIFSTYSFSSTFCFHSPELIYLPLFWHTLVLSWCFPTCSPLCSPSFFYTFSLFSSEFIHSNSMFSAVSRWSYSHLSSSSLPWILIYTLKLSYRVSTCIRKYPNVMFCHWTHSLTHAVNLFRQNYFTLVTLMLSHLASFTSRPIQSPCSRACIFFLSPVILSEPPCMSRRSITTPFSAVL